MTYTGGRTDTTQPPTYTNFWDIFPTKEPINERSKTSPATIRPIGSRPYIKPSDLRTRRPLPKISQAPPSLPPRPQVYYTTTNLLLSTPDPLTEEYLNANPYAHFPVTNYDPTYFQYPVTRSTPPYLLITRDGQQTRTSTTTPTPSQRPISPFLRRPVPTVVEPNDLTTTPKQPYDANNRTPYSRRRPISAEPETSRV